MHGYFMNKVDVKGVLNSLSEEVDSITDPKVKSVIKILFNLVEALASENNQLHVENQRLRDENNRLKGEQGKPEIRKQSQSKQDFSSEKERKKKNKKKRKKSKKKGKLKIDRVETLKIDKSQLPSDAKFKGHQSVVVQDIMLKTDNVEFKKEVYYSPSLNKTFMAPLPKGYQGGFGPFIKTLVINLHQTMTEPAILDLLITHGVKISAATVSRMVTDNQDAFHQEKNAIVEAGIQSSHYQQMDDTGARVNGQNCYTHILCNPFFTAYFTRKNKARLTIIGILTQGNVTFCFNESSYALMEQMKLSGKILALLKQCFPQENMDRKEANAFLKRLFPDPKRYTTSRQIILDATAIIAYRQLPNAVQILLTDDAPQYNQITDDSASCWIHDGRHYKKLVPIVDLHRKELEIFLSIYWEFYHRLLDYKEAPTFKDAKKLSNEFDVIFSIKADYDLLNERIEKTKVKKDTLLLVLKSPEIPLHNNASELGARKQARYRDISLQTQNLKGTESKDTFMTITETAKKLCVNTFNYIYDRVSGKCEMPSLAELISIKANDLRYNTS